MLKLPCYCASLRFSATLRNFTVPLLYYNKNKANISLPVTAFLGVMGASLAILHVGHLKLPSQISKVVIVYGSVA